MTETADVILIGGGIHGASLAFHLAKRGLKPIVLEKNYYASGATGRSSGLVRMHYDLEPESRLAWESFKYFSNWADVVGGDCGFTRTGFLQFVKPDHEGQLRANVIMHQRIGIPSLLISVDDAQRLAPMFYLDDVRIAAFEPESGYADPSSTTKSLLDVARQLGGRLIQDCQVSAILGNEDRISGVKTNLGDFYAPIVVNTSGPWAVEINQMVGLDLPISTWQHDSMFIRRPKEFGPSHPTVIDFPNSMYFRPETGRLTLVGLEDENPLGESPEGDTEHSRPGFVERAIDRICKRIPGIDRGSLHSAHGGYDGITPDQRAILGQAGPRGFYLACGFSGTGFKIGPAVGRCMAELIIDGRANTVDIHPFRPSRFSEGELLEGENAYENIWR